jgi:acyl carrier protein
MNESQIRNAVNFLVALHERLGVEIPEADSARLTTLDAVVAYLVAKGAA